MSFVGKTDANFEYLLVPNASCHFESGKIFQNFFIILTVIFLIAVKKMIKI